MGINRHIKRGLSGGILLVVVGLMFAGLLSCSKKNIKPPYIDEKDAYERAIKMIEDKEYTDGRELLTEVINRDRTKTYAPLAQLKLAESYVKDDESDLAIEEYRKFLNSYPDNRYAANAQYQIAALAFSQIEGADRGYKAAESAIREFKKLADLYPRNPYRDVIELRLQKCRNVLAEHEFYVGKFYFRKASFKAALGRFNVILEQYNDFTDIGEVYYHMAMSYKGLKDKDKAREYFQKTLEIVKEDKLRQKAQKEFNSL
ncbi:outer membrane protein assembly factor BamD [Candidatus Magnetobacterium casense]|uniref:Tetratricopeptide repeat protein n=1 Tax=Candidatus Magnetobacterium casense TaxID=1455061 RepID=A0ABS6RYT3_9BACT|nr:outer membrane protein assembly factor BamD [Candidatus Magnetobacterium casensis]MBV6341741.1 tetratricopeptide repeat protein [Candidatus Magnetobacterium casensis]